MSKFHVSQVETHVRELYGSSKWSPDLEKVANLSRILALHAVTLVLGPDNAGDQRIIEITDGTGDRGIDAIGVDPVAKLVVLVQSKWRQDGTGSMSLADVLKFIRGVRSLLGMRSEEEPANASEDTKVAVRDLLKTPGARIVVITVTTASGPLAPEVVEPIEDILSQLNDLEGVEPLASHRHFDQAALFASISDTVKPAVNIDLQMLDWGRANDPQRIFYGRVSAAEIAAWFRDHGTDLFADNIRVVIPRSDINDGILLTVRDEPERFVYYNNGITILAESIEIGPGGALNKDVGYFKLTNASVVNGAQTVSTLGSALGGDHEANLGNAFVLVRCIEVPTGAESLGRNVTRYANTQNEVSSQDFAFLDREQHRLVNELRVVGYEYILRSAEIPRSKDPAKVIDVRQAAVALACASANPGHAVLAKREVSRLFSDQSVYSALFNAGTDPLRLSRSVEVVRMIDDVLDSVERESDGVTAGIAVHGRRTIAHLILREMGDDALRDPATEMDRQLASIDGNVRAHVVALVDVFPENSYPGNAFKNQSRVAELVKAAGLGVQA